ncbi:MAG: hypothetical protein N3J91_00505 [Verrucomicrobiae bacterium]|nr:hypothetical protein [Verrucomicrobiae bacterium]
MMDINPRGAAAFYKKAGIVALGLAAIMAGAGEPIRFSTSEQKKVEPAKGGANPLEKYLDRPFESLRPDSSLGPVVPPQMLRMTPPALPEKSERERAGWQNSWIFALPQNQARQPTAEEVFKVERVGPDGRPMAKPTLMEQYFQHQSGRNNPERSGKEGEGGPPFGAGLGAGGRPGVDPLNPDRREDEGLGMRREQGGNPALRSILDQEGGSRGSWSRNTVDRGGLGGEVSLNDFFRASQEEMKKERLREERRQEYRLMLESRTYYDLQQGRREGGLGLKTPGMTEAPTIGPSVLREAGGLSRDLKPLNSLNTYGTESMPLRNPSRSLFEERREGAVGGYNPSAGSGLLNETPRAPQQQRERPTVLPVPKRDF